MDKEKRDKTILNLWMISCILFAITITGDIITDFRFTQYNRLFDIVNEIARTLVMTMAAIWTTTHLGNGKEENNEEK